MATLKK